MIQYLTFQTGAYVLLKAFFDCEFLNLHLLTLIVFIGGCYLTFVKNFIIVNNFDFSNRILVLSNIPLHIIPFVYIWSKCEANKKHLLETYLYLTLYYYVFEPHKTYYLTESESKKLMALMVFVLFLFLLI